MDLVGLVTSPLPESANIFISVLNVAIALIGVFFGIWVLLRFEGKLKSAMIFLISAVIVILIREVMVLFSTSPTDFIVGLMRLATVLLIFFAMIFMKQMINKIDGYYKKK